MNYKTQLRTQKKFMKHNTIEKIHEPQNIRDHNRSSWTTNSFENTIENHGPQTHLRTQ